MYTEKQLAFLKAQASSKTDCNLHDIALYSNAYGKIAAGREADLTKEELEFLQGFFKVYPANWSKECGEIKTAVDAAITAKAIE